MKKHIDAVLGLLCYAFGCLFALYVGVWKMLIVPLAGVYAAFVAGELTIAMVAVCALRVLFSGTLAGFIWCIGYIGYNHFKGIEDPDWDLIEEQRSYRDSTGT